MPDAVTTAGGAALAGAGVGVDVVAVIASLRPRRRAVATGLAQAPSRAAIAAVEVAIVALFVAFILRRQVATPDPVTAARQRTVSSAACVAVPVVASSKPGAPSHTTPSPQVAGEQLLRHSSVSMSFPSSQRSPS